jgi:hypothetical protein
MKSFKQYSCEQHLVTYEQYQAVLDGQIVEAVRATRLVAKLRDHLIDVGKDLKISYDAIASAFKQRPLFEIMKMFGFSFLNMSKAVLGSLGLMNVLITDVFKQMEETGDLDRLKSGTMKAEEAIKKYPKLKKVTGPMVASFLIYKWQNAAFTGNFKSDFDMTDILEAAAGKYTIENLLASPESLSGMLKVFLGAVVGISFPWGMILPASLYLAFTYTAFVKARDAKAAKKVKEKIDEMRPK